MKLKHIFFASLICNTFYSSVGAAEFTYKYDFNTGRRVAHYPVFSKDVDFPETSLIFSDSPTARSIWGILPYEARLSVGERSLSLYVNGHAVSRYTPDLQGTMTLLCRHSSKNEAYFIAEALKTPSGYSVTTCDDDNVYYFDGDGSLTEVSARSKRYKVKIEESDSRKTFILSDTASSTHAISFTRGKKVSPKVVVSSVPGESKMSESPVQESFLSDSSGRTYLRERFSLGQIDVNVFLDDKNPEEYYRFNVRHSLSGTPETIKLFQGTSTTPQGSIRFKYNKLMAIDSMEKKASDSDLTIKTVFNRDIGDAFSTHSVYQLDPETPNPNFMIGMRTERELVTDLSMNTSDKIIESTDKPDGSITLAFNEKEQRVGEITFDSFNVPRFVSFGQLSYSISTPGLHPKGLFKPSRAILLSILKASKAPVVLDVSLTHERCKAILTANSAPTSLCSNFPEKFKMVIQKNGSRTLTIKIPSYAEITFPYDEASAMFVSPPSNGDKSTMVAAVFELIESNLYVMTGLPYRKAGKAFDQ